MRVDDIEAQPFQGGGGLNIVCVCATQMREKERGLGQRRAIEEGLNQRDRRVKRLSVCHAPPETQLNRDTETLEI